MILAWKKLRETCMAHIIPSSHFAFTPGVQGKLYHMCTIMTRPSVLHSVALPVFTFILPSTHLQHVRIVSQQEHENTELQSRLSSNTTLSNNVNTHNFFATWDLDLNLDSYDG